MTDIDAIRKKHEAQMEYTKSKQGDAPYLFQSIHSNLSISDVDALLAALDDGVAYVNGNATFIPHEIRMGLIKILKGGGDERCK